MVGRIKGIKELREFNDNRLSGGFYNAKLRSKNTSMTCGETEVFLFISEKGLDTEKLPEIDICINPKSVRYDRMKKYVVIEMIDELKSKGLVKKFYGKYLRTQQAEKGEYEFQPMCGM